MRKLALFVAAAVAAAVPTVLRAQAATTDVVSFGAFVDGYYAWDFGEPPTLDRSFAGGALFTTQPARHNEFNVNLAFVEAKLSGESVRGRLALQAGTSVQSNYSAESASGQISGPSLAQHIQEAVVGVKVGDATWIDGGIFYSHMGMESWASRDNPTYTRSLVAEYSPYYQSGAKLTWAVSPRFTAQVDVVNGWQNISENNTGKGVGVRLDFTPSATTTVSYYNLFSDEAGNRLRTFNGIATKIVSGRATFVGQLDLGSQANSAVGGGSATWYGLTAIGRLQTSGKTAVSARLERFDDEDQVIIATGGGNGPFQGNGFSLGVDITPQQRLLWRTEARFFQNDTEIFPDGAAGPPKKTDGFVVSSLAVTF